MRPTDHRIDVDLCEALSCAEHRFPRVASLRNEAAENVLGLRYALIGISAVSFILQGCSVGEQRTLLPQLRFFGTMIREHIEQDLSLRPHHYISDRQAIRAQEIYGEIFKRFIEFGAFDSSIDLLLSVLVEDFVDRNSKQIKGRVLPWAARGAKRQFDLEAQKSLQFALSFFERRKLDLEELPEIALLGE